MISDIKPVFFADQSEFRKWLEENQEEYHPLEHECKAGSNTTLTVK